MIINKIAELIKDEPELKLKVDNEFEQVKYQMFKICSKD